MFVVCAPAIATGQEEGHMYLGGIAGLNDFHSKDNHINPLSYSGGIFSGALSLDILTQGGRHMIEIRYSSGDVHTKYRQDDASSVVFSASYAYCAKLAGVDLMGRRMDLMLGGGVSTGGWSTNYAEARGQYSTWWLWTYYLSENANVVARCEYDIAGNSRLYLDVVLPVVQLVSRPAYSGWGAQDQLANVLHPNVHFLWNNFSAMAGVGYTFPFAGPLMLKLDYRFSYVFTPEPLPVKMYDNSLLVGLYLKL